MIFSQLMKILGMALHQQLHQSQSEYQGLQLYEFVRL